MFLVLEIPEPYYMTGVVAWIAFQIATPFLIFAFRPYLPRSPGSYA